MLALREVLKSGQMTGTEILLQQRHFQAAFSSVRPSVGARDRQRYEVMRRRYGVSPGAEESEEAGEIETKIEIDGDVGGDVDSDVDDGEKVESELSDDIKIQDVVTVGDMEEEDDGSSRPELRFLPGMEVRVSDSCEVAAIAGHIGVVTAVSEAADRRVEVSILDLASAGSCQHSVPAGSLEPSLPGEEDPVKILVRGGHLGLASVTAISEEDVATVTLAGGGDTATFPVDKLCKANTAYLDQLQ